MKILHCCLAAFYIDGYGYQENILPRVHQSQGHTVEILASTETYLNNQDLGYVEPSRYTNEDGIPVTRLAYSPGLPHPVARKVRSYAGLFEAVEAFEPDVLFLHDCQFFGVREVRRYAIQHPHVRIYVDCHTDFINSARGFVSKHILHRMLYRYCAKLIEPHVQKFWGVLPARVDFLKEMYGTPPEKTDLLVLGADDAQIDWPSAATTRLRIRQGLGLKESDFVLLCGGKIDRRKQIHDLMRAVRQLKDSQTHLILFGTPNEEMAAEIEALSRDDRIHSVGWIAANKTYDYLLAADLGIFPGTHSVLWEQAVGTGLPCVFRRWPRMEHVDVGGNCEFFERGDEKEIKQAIERLRDDPDRLERMRQVALAEGVRTFSYSEIARRAIEA